LDAFDRVLAVSNSSLDEIVGNLRIRDDFISLFVARAQELYNHADMPNYAGLRQGLDRALSHKQVKPDSLFRGLFVETASTFERGVKSIASAAVLARQRQAVRYSALDPTFRDRHTVQTSKILAKLFEGTLHGAPYDFDRAQKVLGLCLTDAEPLELNSGVFSAFIGSCSPENITNLFQMIGLSDPFSDEISNNTLIKAWVGKAVGREATKQIVESLDEHLARRNAIVHSEDHSVSLVSTDIERYAELVRAILSALVDVARKGVSAKA
jgi:hypothetical protein